MQHLCVSTRKCPTAHRWKELHTVGLLDHWMWPQLCSAWIQQDLQVLIHLKIRGSNVCNIFGKQRDVSLCLYLVYKTGLFSYILFMAFSELAGNNDELFMCFLNSSIWIKRRQNAAYCYTWLCRDDLCNNSPGLSHHAAVKASQLPAPNGSGFPKCGGGFPAFLCQCHY